MPYDWLMPSEEDAGNATPTSGSGMTDYFHSLDTGTWEDFGIYEKNSMTGELRLKDQPGRIGGLLPDAIGHYEDNPSGIAEFKPYVNIQIDDNNTLDNFELDRLGNDFNKNNTFDWLDLAVNAPMSGLISTIAAPAVGALAAGYDVGGEVYDFIGAHDYAKRVRESRDEVKDTSQLMKETAQSLLPPSDSTHPVKEIWEDVKNLDPVEFYKDAYSFTAATAAPMAAIAATEAMFAPEVLAAEGASAVAHGGVKLGQWIYGLAAFDDHISSTRYNPDGSIKDGTSAIGTAAWAIPSAIIQGKMEQFSLDKQFEKIGSEPIKHLLGAGSTEFLTEAGQTLVGDTFKELPDVISGDYLFGPKDINWGVVKDWSANELGKAWWDGLGGAITSSAVTGANYALQQAGADIATSKQNSGNDTDILYTSLSDAQKQAIASDIGQLKVMLDAQNAGPENWKPEHVAAIKIITAKWGRVDTVSQVLKEVTALANDPIKIGQRQANEEATPGGQDLEDFTGDPVDSAFNIFLHHDTPSNQVGALSTFVQAKKLFTTDDLNATTETVRTLDASQLAPSEYELLTRSLRAMVSGSDSPEHKNALQAEIRSLESYANDYMSKSGKAATRIIEPVLSKIKSDTPVGVISGMVKAVSDKLKGSVGKLIGDDGQKYITDIQSRLFSVAEELSDADKVGTPEYRSVIESIQTLNQFLSTNNVALAEQRYIEPAAVWVQMGKDADAITQVIGNEHDVIISALQAAVNIGQEENKRQGALGLTPKQILMYASKSLSNLATSQNIDRSAMTDVSELINDMRDAADSENPDFQGIASKAKDLSDRISESRSKQIDNAVIKLMSNYSKAATVQAAKGQGFEPIDLAFMSIDGEQAMKIKQNEANAKIEVKKNASKKLYKLLQYFKYKDDGNKDGFKLDYFMHSATDSIIDSVPETGLLEDADGFEDSKNLVNVVVSGMYRAELAQSKGSNAMAVVATKQRLNQLFVKLGLLKSKKSFSRYKNPKTGLIETDKRFLFDYAKAKGMLVPTPSADGTQLLAPNGKTFLEIRDAVSQSFDNETKAYQNGTAQWDEAVANSLFNLIDNKTMEGMIIASEGQPHTVGGRANSKLAGLISRSFPRGSELPPELVHFGTESLNPNATPEFWDGITAPLIDAQRAAIINRKLFSALGKSSEDRADGLYFDAREVVKDISGIGEYSKLKYLNSKRQWNDVRREVAAETRESTANPSSEMREPSGHRDWIADPKDTEQWGEAERVKGERWRVDENGAQVLDGYGMPIWEDPTDTETVFRRVAGESNFAPQKARTYVPDVEARHRADLKRRLQNDTNAQRASDEWEALQDLRRSTLVRFYNVTSSLGQRWLITQDQMDEVYRTDITGVLSAEAKATLKYIEKVFDSTSRSAQDLGTPTGIAFAMAKNGYDAEEVTLAVGLIVQLAKTWAKNTGKPIYEFYNKATHMVVGVADTGEAKQYGVNIKSNGFQKLKKSWIALTKKLTTPNDRKDIFVPVHEFLHSMITSGQMYNMFSDADRTQVEKWLGARLPRVNPTTGTVWTGENMDTAKEERLIAGITMSVATTDFTRTSASYAKAAVMRVRDTMFDLFHDVYGQKRAGVSWSQQDMMAVQNDIPEDVHKALVNIFGVNSLGAAAYRVSPTGVTITAAHRLVGQIKAAIGVDISPLLEEKFNSIDEIFAPGTTKQLQLLKGIVGQKYANASSREQLRTAVNAGFAEFKHFLGVDNKTINATFNEHLKFMFREIRVNEDVLQDYEKILFNKRNAPVVTKEDSIQATEDVYDLPEDNELSFMADTSDDSSLDDMIDAASRNREEFDSKGYAAIGGGSTPPPKRTPRPTGKGLPKRKRTPIPRNESAKVAKVMLGVATPLAFQDSTEITEPLARFLRTNQVPILTGNANMTGKNAKNIAVRALQLTHNLGKLFNTNTFSLEKYLISKGLTREYLMVHNLGGLYAQARAAVENKVEVMVGPLGREHRIVIGESLKDIVEEMPEQIQQDVWTYLSAKREMEIARTAKKRRDQYVLEVEMYNRSEGQLPKPKEPTIPEVDPNTLAAAVLFETYAEAKYGFNAGAVGDYAKRIADFGNNAIAKKLHHYGLLSKEELGNLLKDGEWWIPQSYLKELTDDLDTNEPFFNDGTKAALNVLKKDRTGTEHPFEELVRRTMSVHMLTTRAFVRSSVIRSLVRDAPAGDLNSIGMKKITTMIPKRVDEDTYNNTPADLRLAGKMDRATGEWIHLINEEVELDRRGYSRWAIEHPNEKKNVYAVWENGQAQYYEVADAQMRKAIDSLKVEEVHPWLKLLSKITSITARMITYAPKFILTMPLKDMAGAGSRSKAGINVLTAPYDLVNGLFHAMPNLFPSLGRRFPKTFWVNNERLGSMASQTSFQSTFDHKGVALNKKTSGKTSILGMMGDDLLSAYRESNEVKTQKDAAVATTAFGKLFGVAKIGVKGTLELLDRTASTADAALRLAERKLARQGSISDISRMKMIYSMAKSGSNWEMEAKKWDQPGYLSDLYVDALDRQLTLDFSRKGTAVRVISTMKMFAGPMFQDTSTTLERLGNPISRKAFIFKSLMAFTLPALLNWIRWEDDEDYQRLTYWDKLNFYQINKTADNKFNQIPTGIGLASVLFKDTFLTIAQIISDNDRFAGKEWMAQLVEQTPLQFVPFIQDSRDFVSHTVPTALEPTADVAMNWNPLSNSPIDYDKGKQNAPLPEDRGVEKYGVAEKALASFFDTSPRVTGYWMRQSLPGMGGVIYGLANKAATTGYTAAGGDPTVGKQYNPVGTYLWKYWSGEVYGPASLPINRFYDLYEKSANANASIAQAENNGSYDRAEALRRSQPEWAYYDMFKAYYGQIQRMKIDRGMYMKTVDPSDPMAKLFVKESFDKPMTLLAEEANRTYNDILKSSYNR